MVTLVGEALVGEGNEVAHIDLLMGERGGAVDQAFAMALANPQEGHTPLLAVIQPNLLAKPCTLMVNKVTIKNARQAGLVFGPAQAAVAKAVVDSVHEGIIHKDKADEWFLIVSTFIEWDAKDKDKIYENNYEATKLAIRRALAEEPRIDEVLSKREAKHPFR